jgi:uncharacterized protein (DUF58 family)
MMSSRFTLIGRAVVTIIVILFLWAYLFENLLVGMAGAGILLYLAYRRMEFHSLLRQVDVKVKRKVFEEVIHKDTPFTVGVEVLSTDPIEIRSIDRVPDQFRSISGSNSIHGMIRPDEPLHTSYSIQALERGMFKMPPLKITVFEGRGLYESKLSIDPRTELFVRASKKEIALAHLMSKRKQFEITGPAHLRHSRTFQTDFRSIREYMPGDRFRDIDWKAASRLTKLMTKEFEKETNLPTLLLMDTSLSMKELVKRRSKLDHAIGLALQVAIVMDKQHHPVGLMTFDETNVREHISPGTVDVEEIVLSLFKLPNPIETGEYPGQPQEFDPLIKEDAKGFISAVSPFLHKRHRKTGSIDNVTGIFKALGEMKSYEETGLLIVLITDLETNTPSMMKAMKIAVTMNHRVVLISPFSWPYHLEGIELDPDLLEKVYQEKMRKQGLIKAIRSSGVRVIEINSKERGDSVLSGLRRLSK